MPETADHDGRYTQAEVETRVLTRAGALVTPARTLFAARNEFSRHAYDLVLLDLALPDGHAGAFAVEVLGTLPRPALLVVSGHLEATECVSLQAMGAITVRKSDLGDRLVEFASIAACRESKAAAKAESSLDDFSRRFNLSGRKREVFEMLVLGLRPKEIATNLEVAESTVRRHVQDVCDQCGVSTQVGLMALLSRTLMVARAAY
jgi:DNA-binding NarL/FixJ family response regulator